ncbi:MAG TPA: 2-amino-4-hydroxy-6-hydroxymethyldihydropteridine diphosphokinase [Flavobacteriaceae bacterium]|nr:2-amino-4-hydroxy-6-hydroxymethyldihydropteridine diphosphokinase [Flavobacteriaceae bacterium]HIP26568.1 2-amino-4-hydroxy-6-hydroxymethyldihydropteridine diphosphokinase [Flavobacteriaceae bacterium]
MKKTKTIFLSLGSNKGNCLENLQKAIDNIAVSIGKVVQLSSVYKTKPWGFESDDFLNVCIEISSKLDYKILWSEILIIEEKLGRNRNNSDNYQARTIDIDVLFINDEVVFSKELIVPHSKMLERNFVLVPLNEIAPDYQHPIVKKNIQTCLENCEDIEEVFKIDLKLVKPLSLDQKYNYIAIEGNIGAGKTTLSNMIGNEFNARLVLERFADNPFLPKFYEDKDRYAFPLEMSFLADRYQQLSDGLAQYDLFQNLIVSDYYIFKSLIFSQITLQKDEYNLYRRMFDVMYKEITKPDLYIYLYQNTDRLIDNIKKRGREYEQDIQPGYLDKIHKGYFNFIKSQQDLNTLIIDVSEMDFVKNKDDYNSILKKIKIH